MLESYQREYYYSGNKSADNIYSHTTIMKNDNLGCKPHPRRICYIMYQISIYEFTQRLEVFLYNNDDEMMYFAPRRKHDLRL